MRAHPSLTLKSIQIEQKERKRERERERERERREMERERERSTVPQKSQHEVDTHFDGPDHQ